MNVESTRVAVVACPDWQAVAAQCELRARGQVFEAVAVLHAQRVIARTAAAAAQGVQVGMRKREAQGACPHMHIATHSPERDRLMFEPVVRAIAELAPLVEVSMPGIVVLATRGPSRYVGGDDVLAQRLTHIAEVALRELGQGQQIPFGVGIADGRLTAMIAARSAASVGQPRVVARNESAQCLAVLPVSVLADFAEVDRNVVSLLQRLGLAHLGNIAEIQPSILIGRFGPVGNEMHRLARGLDRHPPIVVAPPPERASTHRFDGPVEDINIVVLTAREVAEQLVVHLAAHGASCVRVHISLHTDHGEQSDRVWYQPEGLTAAAMAERVRWQMEAWVASRAVTSGVVLFRLSPIGLRAREGRQLGLWGGSTQADEWAERAIERLTAMLGAQSVLVPEWRGGRDPAEMFALTSASVVDIERRALSCVESETQWQGALPTPSPSVVYDDPLPIMVCSEDGAEVTVSGRHELSAEPSVVILQQHQYSVISWTGPWPVEERWWDPARQRRMVRMQIVVSRNDAATTTRALVVVREHGKWWVVARYG
jgi:protein ImuB